MELEKSYLGVRFPEFEGIASRIVDEWRVHHKDEYYDISTIRERLSPALSKTRTYHLRRPDVEGVKITRTESTQDIMKMVDTPLCQKFEILMLWIAALGRWMRGPKGWTTLGRVFVTRLDGMETIGRHIDEGLYFRSLHRFHIVLQSDGSRFCWDNEQQSVLKQGEFWMVNNSVPHWVQNDGRDRTHLIFDAC